MTPGKFTRLTPEQEALLPIVRDEWITFSLAGGSDVDKSTLRECINWMYALANLPCPPLVIVVDSPIAAQIAANAINKPAIQDAVRVAVHDVVHDMVYVAVHDVVHDMVYDAVDGAVDGAVRGAVRGAVHDMVYGAVHDAVGVAVGGAVHDAVDDAVGGAVGDAVDSAVGDAVHGAVGVAVYGAVRVAVHDMVYGAVHDMVYGAVHDAVHDMVYGAVSVAVHDAVRGNQNFTYYSPLSTYGWWMVGLSWGSSWAAYTDFFDRIGWLANICPPETYAHWQEWRTFLRCGVWQTLFFRNAAICVRRPTAVRKDGPLNNPAARLHSTTGLAVEWADGSSSFGGFPCGTFFHGVRVPEEWVFHPERITVAEVLKQSNVEVRRIALGLMSRERFLTESNAQLVDHDHDLAGQERHLWRIDVPDDEPVLLCQVTCPSTGKAHYLQVPPDSKRCSEAVAWTFGFEAPDQYRPVVEA